MLGIVSAIGTYVPRITLPAWVSPVILVAAVLFASYDVYRKQQREIEELRSTNLQKRAQLVIHPYESSRYIVNVAREDRTKILGMLIELHISIENKGSRHSTIVRCDLTVSETGESYPNIKPRFLRGIQGREANCGLDQSRYHHRRQFSFLARPASSAPQPRPSLGRTPSGLWGLLVGREPARRFGKAMPLPFSKP